jgi:hypothetical protein
MLSGMGVRRAAWDAAEVTVSGDSFTAFNVGADAQAFMIWNQDGTRDEKQNADAATQVFASTDWVIPNGAAPGSNRIRHTSATGDTADFTPAGTINVYLALTSNRLYDVLDTTAAAASKSVTFNIQIDDGAGNVLSQASQTLTADREDF